MLLASIPALKLSSLINALPGCIAQGIVWGIMALGLFSRSGFWTLQI